MKYHTGCSASLKSHRERERERERERDTQSGEGGTDLKCGPKADRDTVPIKHIPCHVSAVISFKRMWGRGELWTLCVHLGQKHQSSPGRVFPPSDILSIVLLHTDQQELVGKATRPLPPPVQFTTT